MKWIPICNIPLPKNIHSKEHTFLKCKGNKREKTYKRNAFLNSRKLFDKELRKAERLYKGQVLNEIDTACTDNHRAFWDYIKKVGPRKVSHIPMKVYQGNDLVSDMNMVKDTWKQQFSDLYNRPEDEGFDNVYYNEALNQKETWENEMSQPGYDSNVMLNMDISFDEVEKMTRHLKNNKACGFDKIPNEVLKRPEVHTLLFNIYKLFLNVVKFHLYGLNQL